MKCDESSNDRDNSGPHQFNQLNKIFVQIVDTLEQSRNDIFSIAVDCYRQCALIEGEKDKLKVRPCPDIERQTIELDEQIDKIRTLAEKAEKLLSNTGLALKIMQENNETLDFAEKTYTGQQLTTLIIKSREFERRGIAREIHDGPAQSLASMLISLDLIEKLGLTDENQIYEEIKNIKKIGKESLLELRHIMFDLKPVFLKEGDFYSALKKYFKDYEARYGFNIDFISSGNRKECDYSLKLVLFRLVQEGINNARKHSGVNRAAVKMEDDEKYITLVIKDEGSGFDVKTVNGEKDSYGISGMKERVEIIGGEMQIVSSPGSGTGIIIKVPLKREGQYYGQDQGPNSG